MSRDRGGLVGRLIRVFRLDHSHSDEAQRAAMQVLAAWTPDTSNLNDTDLVALSKLSERSLSEVKALTEYEDQKAQRILTAMAFIAALAGALFAVVSRMLPISTLTNSGEFVAAEFTGLVESVYALFILFTLLVVIGALFLLWAVRPRFKIPLGWTNNPGETYPKSFLFFERIVEVSPESWVKSFVRRSVREVQLDYARNYIFESYLVASKIPVKLRWFNAGVWLFIAAKVVLAIWIVLVAITVLAIYQH